MQKFLKIINLKIQNFFIKENLGIFVYKNKDEKIDFSFYPTNFSKKEKKAGKKYFIKKSCRAYIAISHEFLDFEIIKLPSQLSFKKQISAAKLEATRIFHLFDNEPDKNYFSFYPLKDREILVSRIKEKTLKEILNFIPKDILIGGIFPAWSALWAYLSYRELLEDNNLYYIFTGRGYEGLWLKNKNLGGIIPFSPQAGEIFISHYKGNKVEIKLIDHLAEGAYYFPLIFPIEKNPAFEEFPYLVRHKIPLKYLSLWIIPLIILSLGYSINLHNKELLLDIDKIELKLKNIKKEYKTLEDDRKKIEEKRNLYLKIRKYLPGHRPPVLRALLEITLSLPEDAWIYRFEYRYPNQIRFWGKGKNALKVLESLSENDFFKNVKFISTVTKNPYTELENFSIQLSISLPDEEKNQSDN